MAELTSSEFRGSPRAIRARLDATMKRRNMTRLTSQRYYSRLMAEGLVQLNAYLNEETKSIFDEIKGRLEKTVNETARDMIAFYRDARRMSPLCVPLESKEHPEIRDVNYHRWMTAQGLKVIHVYADKDTKEAFDGLKEETGLNTSELFEDMVRHYYKAMR